MTPATLAYLLAVLFVAAAMLDLGTRPAYSCPSCGTKRADGHASECPWRHKP
jgi:hypothetical protein